MAHTFFAPRGFAPIPLELPSATSVCPADLGERIAKWLPGSVRALAPGEALIRHRNSTVFCYWILDGWIGQGFIHTDGQFRITDVWLPSEIWLVPKEDATLHPQTVHALTKARVCAISRADWKTLIQALPAINDVVTRQLAATKARQSQRKTPLHRGSGLQSVALLLLELHLRLTRGQKQAPGTFRLPLTAQQIAEITSLTSVDVRTILNAFAQSGQISFSPAGEIDLDDIPALCASAQIDLSDLQRTISLPRSAI